MKSFFSRTRRKPSNSEPFVAWLEDLSADHKAAAGGKGASLGDMLREGLPVPPGFVVCASGFRAFLDATGGLDVILRSVDGLDVQTEAKLTKAALSIHNFILSQALPVEVGKAIRDSYARLGKNSPVAVRSSAVSEDSDSASFAGQQETFLNVRGADAVVKRVQACWASFFMPRAIFYRAQKGSLDDSAMAVVVQKMVHAEKSGILFTRDPVQRNPNHMMIEAVYGLGEAVVSGKITPDQYVIDRGTGALVQEHIAIQPSALIYDETGEGIHEIPLSAEQGSERVLGDAEIRQLHDLGHRLESRFGKPQDIEWAIERGQIFLLQSRPITTL